MPKKRENATIGKESERQFSNLLVKDISVINVIKKRYKLKSALLEVHTTGMNLKKSDALLVFGGNKTIGVNIKSGKVGFNQVTRIWLSKLSQEIGIAGKVIEYIQKGIDNHRLKQSKIFIEADKQELVKKEIKRNLNKILELIFKNLGNDTVRILALFDRNKKIYYLYDMQEVIKLIEKTEITFSKKGILNIGPYITMQRKGGNGVKQPLPKRSPKHPGNQIQFKMKIIDFMNANVPFAILK